MATTMARPRQPKGGYRNKYYDPAAAHKYYLSRRKLKGYKDRYKNSDRRRKRGDEDEEQRNREDVTSPIQQEKDREDEEREAEELLELAEEQEDEQESARKLYAHTGDKRTGIHAARGWTVMHTQQANMSSRGALGKSNAQVRNNKEEQRIDEDIVPDGYILPDDVQQFVDTYDALVTRISNALEYCEPEVRESVEQQLDALSDQMKNLVVGKAVPADSYGRAKEINGMRSQIERYNRSLESSRA